MCCTAIGALCLLFSSLSPLFATPAVARLAPLRYREMWVAASGGSFSSLMACGRGVVVALRRAGAGAVVVA